LFHSGGRMCFFGSFTGFLQVRVLSPPRAPYHTNGFRVQRNWSGGKGPARAPLIGRGGTVVRKTSFQYQSGPGPGTQFFGWEPPALRGKKLEGEGGAGKSFLKGEGGVRGFEDFLRVVVWDGSGR